MKCYTIITARIRWMVSDLLGMICRLSGFSSRDYASSNQVHYQLLWRWGNLVKFSIPYLLSFTSHVINLVRWLWKQWQSVLYNQGMVFSPGNTANTHRLWSFFINSLALSFFSVNYKFFFKLNLIPTQAAL